MSFYCNFSNGSNCSDVFQDVHVALTVIQGIFALANLTLTVPLNVLLLLVMSIYRKMLDKSISLLISSVVSNIIVSVFLNSAVFFTSILRSWLLGYWGCQIFSFLLSSGIISSGLAVIHSCFDIYVLKSYSTVTFEQNFFYVLLILSWMLPVLFSAVFTLKFPAQFDATIPGCLEPIAVSLTGIVISLWTLFLSGFLCIRKCYKVMRHMFISVHPSGITDRNNDQPRKVKRLFITNVAIVSVFCLMIILLMARVTIDKHLSDTNVSTYIIIPILYGLSLAVQLYIVASILIILSNKKIFEATRKLLNQILKQRRIQPIDQE